MGLSELYIYRNNLPLICQACTCSIRVRRLGSGFELFHKPCIACLHWEGDNILNETLPCCNFLVRFPHVCFSYCSTNWTKSFSDNLSLPNSLSVRELVEDYKKACASVSVRQTVQGEPVNETDRKEPLLQTVPEEFVGETEQEVSVLHLDWIGSVFRAGISLDCVADEVSLENKTAIRSRQLKQYISTCCQVS
jgi:hypothetical protein